jgi:HD-GYP domain-containing protein (c-di-GMP phosphodiesterase class II)
VRRSPRWLILAVTLSVAGMAFGAEPERQAARARTQRFQEYRSRVLSGGMGQLLRELEAHHKASWRHSIRVARLSRRIAATMGFREKDQHRAWLAGLAHDIGKLDISRELLDNQDDLTPEELRLIQQHPENGAARLLRMRTNGAAVTGALTHHERIDGQGYPRKLEGREIPRFGRIVAVADSFEAMTELRSYQKPLTQEEARRVLIVGKGLKFDSEVVDAFVRLTAK